MKIALKFLPAVGLLFLANLAQAQTAPAPSSGTAAKTSAAAPASAGYIVMNSGKMVLVDEHGSMVPMPAEMTLADGSKVMKDGTVVTKAGKRTTLKDKQSIGLDGQLR